MIMFEPCESIAEWVSERTGGIFNNYRAIAYCDKQGFIKAGAVFNLWTGNDISATVAAEILHPSFLKALGQYCFGTLKCNRVSLRTRADNTSAISAIKRIGCKLEGRQARWYVNCDALIFGVLKEDYLYHDF